MVDVTPEEFGTFERMSRGDWYYPGTPGTVEEQQRTFDLMKQINDLGNTDHTASAALMAEVIRPGSAVPSFHTPLTFEYGANISFGSGCFINFGSLFLAEAPITFGDDCLIGPNCSFITVTHPVNDHEMRQAGWERGVPITVGNNCWFATGVTVLPGVTIGDNCVLAAGSLITKDVPSNSLVMGSPARVVRTLDGSDLEREAHDGPVWF